MSAENTQTASANFHRVLVVHSPSYDATWCCAALRTRFIVRTATSADEAASLARGVDLACIVGVIDETLTARAIVEAVGFVAPSRLVLVRTPNVVPDDDVLMLTDARVWLPFDVSEKDFLARIEKAVGA